MTKYTYDSTDAWAYGMLDLIGTFTARVDLNAEGLKRLKELIPEYCGSRSTDYTYGRAVEAAIGQFIAQIEHINEEDHK
jgi:hypothetical protein